MFLLIVFLSYLFGCASTIGLIVYLYVHYGLSPPGAIAEQEQYQTFRPLPENDQSKNSTVDTVNYLIQFLFQEMKDASKVRRYITKKLTVEFNELKATRIGKLFLQDIVIQSFSLGQGCPILTDIQFERHERDERQLIKNYIAKLHVDYKDGFSVTLDIKLAFEQRCQLFIKIKRIQGHLRLELRREPFSHWLLVFDNEPLIDLEIKSYLSTHETAQLAQIIDQRIRRAIRRKQIWPNYKIRYRPFFPTSKQSLPVEVASVINDNLIPGKFHVAVNYCDRLSIPYEALNQEQCSSLFIFLTININKQMCKDYLRINRDQWIKQEMEILPHTHKIRIREVSYMDRTELLLEEFDPIPDGVDDLVIFKEALEDKNVFLLQIQGQDVKRLKETNRLLRDKSIEGKIRILVGIPLLQCVKVRHVPKSLTTDEQWSTTVRRRRTAESVDRSMNASSIERDDDIQEQSSNATKAMQQQKTSSIGTNTLTMMNVDHLEEFQARPTLMRRAAPHVEFSDEFKFQVGSDKQFLNICLWCKPPLDCDAPNIHKKLILLGYATIALSEIVLNAHMSFKRETQMTLNFRMPNSSKSSQSARKNLTELKTHKNYDDNMAHGFVTINIRHEPEIERRLYQEPKKEQASSMEKIICHNEKLTSINEESVVPAAQSVHHLFEDQIFSVETFCSFCEDKIWRKSGRQCRYCLVNLHKKCEEKYNREHICAHEAVHSNSSMAEENNSLGDHDSISTTNQPIGYELVTKPAVVTTFSGLGSTVRRPFRVFGNRNTNQPLTSTLPQSSKDDQLDVSRRGKRSLSNPPIPKTSKLAHVASSAYNKFLEFGSKRTPVSLPSTETRRARSSSASENISEDDLQDIFEKCLTDGNIDMKSLENLFREKSVDHTTLYAKVNQFGAELFRELTLEERKQKLDSEISRLQQEIELQDLIRDELIFDYNKNNLTDENAKRKILAKIANVDEKVQALAALTIFYCSGLKHCCSQMEAIGDNHSKSSDDNL